MSMVNKHHLSPNNHQDTSVIPPSLILQIQTSDAFPDGGARSFPERFDQVVWNWDMIPAAEWGVLYTEIRLRFDSSALCGASRFNATSRVLKGVLILGEEAKEGLWIMNREKHNHKQVRLNALGEGVATFTTVGESTHKMVIRQLPNLTDQGLCPTTIMHECIENHSRHGRCAAGTSTVQSRQHITDDKISKPVTT